AADWGKSDPLKVPKTGQLMHEVGFSDAEIEQVLFYNPIHYYAQSGKISVEEMVPAKIDQTQRFQENSVLRGQTPVVE
ncbi:MAG: TatD family hydrolase, partial [Halothiobacillaceae bacterium]